MQTKVPPRIAIIGAGSVGCFIGGCFAASRTAVIMLGRDRIKHQIQQSGLRITDYLGRDHYVTIDALNFTTELTDISSADFVLITVKSGDTLTTAEQIKPHLNANAVVISLQNGVRNAGIIKSVLAKHQVVKGMVPFNVLNIGSGHFHRGTQGNLAIEASAGEHKYLVTSLHKAMLPVSVYQDITAVQWGKLIMNLNNSVNALSGIPLLEQLNHRGYRNIMAKVIDEALNAMRAANIKPARTGNVMPALMPFILKLPNFLFKRIAKAMLTIDPKARSSMYEDFVLKRTTEIDYLNGEILHLAALNGMSTPVNSVIVKLVKNAEVKQQGSPHLSAEFLNRAIDEQTEDKNHA